MFTDPNYNQLIKLFNNYGTYLVNKKVDSIHNIIGLVRNKDFVDYLTRIDNIHILESYERKYMIDALNQCLHLNNMKLEKLKELGSTIQEFSDINIGKPSSNGTTNLLNKLDNSVSLLKYTYNKSKLRVNQIDLNEALDKRIDRSTLERYNIDCTIDYVKHIIYTIYIDEHLYGTQDRFNNLDQSIIFKYDSSDGRKPNDIIKSNIHVDMDKLSDEIYDEIVSCASSRFHSFIFYERDLYTFLNKVKNFVDGVNICDDDDINIICAYMKDNKETINNTSLFNNDDMSVISKHVNMNITDIKDVNNKLNKIINQICL